MNVFDYFQQKLGATSADETLSDLDIDTPCGRDCVDIIDWTAECLARVPANAEAWIKQHLINDCDHSCQVYWRG